MKVSEAFLVNTKNFDTIINALVKYNPEAVVIDSELLEHLGYSDPNDLLVIRLLKDLNIIDNEGEPGPYFEEFQDPDTTNIAIAKGVLEAYEGVFTQYPKVYQLSINEIKEAFKEIFEDDKTDLIIKYISRTFHKLVNYVGIETISKLRDKDQSPVQQQTTEQPEPAVVETAQAAVKETTDAASGETIGRTDIEQFISTLENSSNHSSTNNTVTKTEEPPVDTRDEQPAAVDSIEKETAEEPQETQEDTAMVEKTAAAEQDRTTEEESTIEEINTIDEEVSATKDDIAEETENALEKHPTAVEEKEKQTLDLEAPMEPSSTDNASIETAQFVQKALLRKSDLLYKMKRWDDLLPTLEQIIDRYDSNKHPNLKEAVAHAIIRRAISLLKLNRPQEALPALNSVIDRFKNSDNQDFYNQASHAMLYKAQILEKQDKEKELLPLYNTIVNRLDRDSKLQMHEKVNQIYLKRFDLILKVGDKESLLEASTQLINRFKDSADHAKYLQKAMIKRAEVLDQLNRDEEALEAYDNFLKQFG